MFIKISQHKLQVLRLPHFEDYSRRSLCQMGTWLSLGMGIAPFCVESQEEKEISWRNVKMREVLLLTELEVGCPFQSLMGSRMRSRSHRLPKLGFKLISMPNLAIFVSQWRRDIWTKFTSCLTELQGIIVLVGWMLQNMCCTSQKGRWWCTRDFGVIWVFDQPIFSGNELYQYKNTVRRQQNDIRYLEQFTGKTATGLKIRKWAWRTNGGKCVSTCKSNATIWPPCCSAGMCMLPRLDFQCQVQLRNESWLHSVLSQEKGVDRPRKTNNTRHVGPKCNLMGPICKETSLYIYIIYIYV